MTPLDIPRLRALCERYERYATAYGACMDRGEFSSIDYEHVRDSLNEAKDDLADRASVALPAALDRVVELEGLLREVGHLGVVHSRACVRASGYQVDCVCGVAETKARIAAALGSP